MPHSFTCRPVNSSRLQGEYLRRYHHEEAVVEHETILAEALGIQLLPHDDSIGGGEEVVEENIDVAAEVEGEIVARRHHGSEQHEVDGQLDRPAGTDFQEVKLSCDIVSLDLVTKL